VSNTHPQYSILVANSFKALTSQHFALLTYAKALAKPTSTSQQTFSNGDKYNAKSTAHHLILTKF